MTTVRREAAAYELWRAGRVAEAQPLDERAVASARICMSVHGLLATLLFQLGRPQDAEEVAAERYRRTFEASLRNTKMA